MYQNYPNTYRRRYSHNRYDNRIGFIGPFLLGGITGALIGRPNYYRPYPYYTPYPYYGPYPYY